jgi:hypothetical protein
MAPLPARSRIRHRGGRDGDELTVNMSAVDVVLENEQLDALSALRRETSV